MTLFRHRVAMLAIVLAATISSAAHAQRSDSYTWKVGLNAGIMAFETRGQSTKVVPSAGGHLLIMAHRGGLMVAVDEGIGTNEHASSAVLFNDVRRYSAALMAFPLSGPVEPYLGVGTGILQVVGPRVDPLQYPDPAQQQTILAEAHDRSTSGFLSFIFGVQGRWNRFTVFGQYQVATAPNDDKLLKGPNQTLFGGLRIGLGSAREGVAAGGY